MNGKMTKSLYQIDEARNVEYSMLKKGSSVLTEFLFAPPPPHQARSVAPQQV